MLGCLPLDGESRHSGLFSKHVALDSLNNGLCGRLSVELRRIVFVVDIVSDADEFATIVGAGQKNHSYSNDVGVGDS